MSTAFSESAIEEVRARIDLVELISSYGVQVKSSGATKKACCPFHHEKTPSFHINEAKGFYHCFGCGESGDAFKFVQKMDGVTFAEALRKLAAQCGVKLEMRDDPTAGRRTRLLALLSEIAQFYHRCLKTTKEAQLARDYLNSRDLTEKTVDDYLVGYAPSGVANVLKWAEKHGFTAEELAEAGIVRPPDRPDDLGYHRFGGRLMFSIRDRQGRVVGFSGRQLVENRNSGKYVNSPETLVFKKSKILYGFDRASGAIARNVHHEAIVCEGQIDCIRLQTCGFANAVAGQGTAFTEDHVAMLKQVADQVALVYDDDGAGHKATIKSARLCLAAELPVRVVSLPGGDDPDSFLRSHPAAEFQSMLDRAESIMAFQVRAERAKESDPGTVDAVSRITRELLTTIAQCPNAILRAGMIAEAAGLMNLPESAMNDELKKVLTSVHRPLSPRSGAPAADIHSRSGGALAADNNDSPSPRSGDAPTADHLAADIIPPPPRELALCVLLMENEYDRNLDIIIGDGIFPEVLSHDFTRRFIDAWRSEVAAGKDLMGEFSERLTGSDRDWFDRVIVSIGKSMPSGASAMDNLKDMLLHLWYDSLRRRIGRMPAQSDFATELEKVRYATTAQKLLNVDWPTALALMRNLSSCQEPST